jgi:Zn-dependent M16 (insulinase) family peptidase
MNTLYKGQILDSGFEVIDCIDLDELKATGIYLRHCRTGLQVFHLLNDDTENLFAFTFATTPEDSTGVAHIIEHSVLCGSEHYPLRDTFLVLGQGSLQTYLNAWTFPDKTVYPISSVNETDYFNGMAVYGDAVFRPLLSEWTFMQEGHRLSYVDGALTRTGVVYNEMKGAYSSMDAFVQRFATTAVLPDTPYFLESGGDPHCIPNLTWEQFKEFHRSRYAPANCRVFLAGNIPTEKQLNFLNDRILASSSLAAGTAAAPVPLQSRWSAPRTVRVPAPAGGDQKSTVVVSWVVGDSTDSAYGFAFDVLVEILLGHDGSPLMRALVESGLGEDISPVSGVESEIRELVFSVGLRGVGGAAEPVQDLVLDELQKLVRDGIAPEEIEAAILSLEFSNREIKRAGGGPYALVWLRRSLRGWLHGRNPWDTLLFMPALTALKAQLANNPRYFEELIQTQLLDNQHRAMVIIAPETDYLERQEAALKEELQRVEASWTDAQRQAVQEKAAALETAQNTPETPEQLACIPHLSRSDLSPVIETIPRTLGDANGIPVVSHELWTNGITYLDLAFPVDVLTAADYPWLPLYTQVATSCGLPGLDYGQVASLFARTAGGFAANLHTGSPVPGIAHTAPVPSGIIDLVGRDWIIFRLKSLDEKIVPAADLALRSLLEADFSDLRHIRDLVLEMKNELDSSLAPAGHSYASTRSGASFSRAKAVDESWRGLSQIEFIHRAASMDTAEISRILCCLRDKLTTSAGLIANITGSAQAIDTTTRIVAQDFSRFGLPRSRNPGLSILPPASPEVFASPSMQVGYAAASLPAAPYPSREHAAEMLLAHYMSLGALWETIRMKGGAYGAFAFADSLEGAFSFATYRDPVPAHSLDTFADILHSIPLLDDDTLEKAIIGTYSGETRPRTNPEKGYIDLLRFFSGIEHQHRTDRINYLLSLSAPDLAAAVDRLASYTGPMFPVIIAGPGIAEPAADKLGITVTNLPV